MWLINWHLDYFLASTWHKKEESLGWSDLNLVILILIQWISCIITMNLNNVRFKRRWLFCKLSEHKSVNTRNIYENMNKTL